MERSKCARRVPRWVGHGVVAVGAVVALGACGSTAKSTGSADNAAGSPVAAQPAGPAGDVNVSGAGGNSQTATADWALAPGGAAAQGASFKVDAVDQPPEQAGNFISTATMTVKVDHVAEAKPKAIQIALDARGQLFGEESSFGEQARAVLTLKVPPDKFADTIDKLGKLGALDTEQVKTDDVTQQVIDLDSRIAAAQSSFDRTRALLDKATNLIDIANLEREVSRRQADLESLRGQQKTLHDRIDLTTITVTLVGEHDATPAQQAEQTTTTTSKPLPGFADGLSGGTEVARNVGTVLLAVVGALLPFTPVLLLGYVIALVARRARRAAGTVTS